MNGSASGSGKSLFRLLPLVFLIVLAAWLRFTGLSWGLRHPLHVDERYFVVNTVEMIRAGDLDQREHRYPGLFFFLLVPGFKWLGPRMDGSDAYLLARALGASFGVLNVALLYLIGSRLVGRWGGFAGGLLFAVMPLDNAICHQVRPETALTTAAVLSIGAFRRVGPRVSGDVLSGLALGFGAALKYTAPFLLPSYLLTRWLAPGRRLLGVLIAGSLMVLVSLLCTPAALLHPVRYFGDMRTVTDSYYVGYTGKGAATAASAMGASTFLSHLLYYLKDGLFSLGLVGTLLSLSGIAYCLFRAVREWGPILLHPLTTLLVMSTATLVFPRQILQAMPLMCLMAGVAVERLGAWNRCAAAAAVLLSVFLGALGVAAPLRASWSFSEAMRRPSSEDKALDWIEANVQAGSRILETRPEANVGEKPGAAIGIDPRRYDVVLYTAHPSPERKKDLALLAPRMSLVITGEKGGGSWAEDLRTVFKAPEDLLLKVPLHPVTCREADLSRARWTLSGVVEEDLAGERSWTTPGPMHGGEWIQVDFGSALPIGEVYVQVLGARRRAGQVALLTAREAGRYESVTAVEVVSSLKGASEVLAISPELVSGVRVEQVAQGDQPWSVRGLTLETCTPGS
jgi:hypothetical protein